VPYSSAGLCAHIICGFLYVRLDQIKHEKGRSKHCGLFCFRLSVFFGKDDIVKVAISYMTVLVVWATTPIAVKYSSIEFGFIPGVSLRVIAAALIVFGILKIRKMPLIVSKRDWLAHISGALALFPTMLLVYFSALYLDSGLISVLFGLSPFFVGVFSIIVLGENPFNRRGVVALAIALLGLLLINSSQLGVGKDALIGFASLLLSVCLFALSTVALKATARDIEPLRQLCGSLVVAAPFFCLAMFFSEGLPKDLGVKALFAMGYLTVFGSIVAGLAFFYVLSRCSVITVSLIPLITPVFAIAIGFIFAGERMQMSALIGSGLILLSLVVYQGLFRKLFFLSKKVLV